jgi:hypothetical protein
MSSSRGVAVEVLTAVDVPSSMLELPFGMEGATDMRTKASTGPGFASARTKVPDCLQPCGFHTTRLTEVLLKIAYTVIAPMCRFASFQRKIYDNRHAFYIIAVAVTALYP